MTGQPQSSKSCFAVVERWTTPPSDPCITETFETREDAERAAAEFRRTQVGGLSYRVEEQR